VVLGNKKISKGSNEYYIIAEIGISFYDIAERFEIDPVTAAKIMIYQAAEAGADAIKFQIFKAERLTSDLKDLEFFSKRDKLKIEDYFELIKFCKKLNVTFAASLFDEELVEIFGPELSFFKIASPDLTYRPLIDKISKFQKPILLSTGASTSREIKWAIVRILKHPCEIVLMHCIASYPSMFDELHLGFIERFLYPPIFNREELINIHGKYEIIPGYSDHAIFNKTVLSTAYVLGARVIEKHFTLNKDIEIDGKQGDHAHSMCPEDLKSLCKELDFIKKIIKTEPHYERQLNKSEEPVRIYGRRSIFAKENINENEKITYNNITYLRPGTGISPMSVNDIVGLKTLTKIEKGVMIDYSMLKK